MVGVRQAVDGNMTEQLDVLKEKANDWGDLIKHGWIPRNYAWQGLRQTIWPSLRYPLPATTMTRKEGAEVVGPLYHRILPSLGANRNFPKVFRHGPPELQGLDMPQPDVEQGIYHITAIMEHGVIDGLLGETQRTALEQTQLEVGTGTFFLELDFDKYGFLATESWVRCLWRFISENKITLRCTEAVTPTLQRENDFFLMEELVERDEMTSQELISVNRCRLNLEALTAACITSGDGRKITNAAAAGERDRDQPSKWIWQKEEPSSTDWGKWRVGLHRLTSATGLLRVPLGRWISEPHKTWKWFYDHNDSCLYRQLGSNWHVYQQTHGLGTRTRQRYRRVRVVGSAPQGIWRATVKQLPYGRVRYEGSASEVEKEETNPTTIKELIDEWELAWPLESSSFPDNGRTVAEALRDGSAIAVADGSYQPKLSDAVATAAWTIHAPKTKTNCSGVCQAAGIRKDSNAYRGELQGIHAALLGILALCKFHEITSGSVRLGCDCETAIKKSEPQWLRVPQKTKHADIIRAIRRLVKEIPVKVNFEHVDGHQDRQKKMEQLGAMEQLNVLMDSRAKQHVEAILDMEERPSPDQRILMEGWQCWVQGIKITSDPGPAIRKLIFGRELKAHLIKKGRLTSEGFELIDWEAIGDASKNLPALYRLWVTKHVSGFCGVGKMMKLWKFWEHNKCPCCQEENETTLHLIYCEDEGMIMTWQDSLEDLDTWLVEEKTAPKIAECIRKTLTPREPTAFEDFGEGLASQAAKDQDKIGWFHFVEGKIATSWETAQHEFYMRRGSDKSGRTWAAGLVTQLYTLAHNQWTCRNGVLHERDAQGLRIKEGEDLEKSIDAQFEMGTEGLQKADWHFLIRGREEIRNLSASDKKAWVSGITIARDDAASVTSRTMAEMRANMHRWLRN